MKTTIKMLADIEKQLLHAELRVLTIGLRGIDPINPNTREDVLQLQMELEAIHSLTTKLENALLKRINETLRNLVEKENEEKEKV